jgi:hypothetical protein
MKSVKSIDHNTEIWRDAVSGLLHRVGGPAVIYPNGQQKWFQNGRLHCEDGPAIIYANQDCEWWINDKRHREDGPAIMYSHGEMEWLDGVKLSFKNWLDCLTCSEEEKVILKLKYS